MTGPDNLTAAQEKLLLELPTSVSTTYKPGQKLLALGLAIYTGDDRSNMAPTEAGRRRVEKIKASRIAAE